MPGAQDVANKCHQHVEYCTTCGGAACAGWTHNTCDLACNLHVRRVCGFAGHQRQCAMNMTFACVHMRLLCCAQGTTYVESIACKAKHRTRWFLHMSEGMQGLATMVGIKRVAKRTGRASGARASGHVVCKQTPNLWSVRPKE